MIIADCLRTQARNFLLRTRRLESQTMTDRMGLDTIYSAYSLGKLDQPADLEGARCKCNGVACSIQAAARAKCITNA